MGLPILDPFVNFVSETLDVPFSKNCLTKLLLNYRSNEFYYKYVPYLSCWIYK
jgi:hypothetical protein